MIQYDLHQDINLLIFKICTIKCLFYQQKKYTHFLHQMVKKIKYQGIKIRASAIFDLLN